MELKQLKIIVVAVRVQKKETLYFLYFRRNNSVNSVFVGAVCDPDYCGGDSSRRSSC